MATRSALKPPSRPLDPRVVELVRALAREAARADHALATAAAGAARTGAGE